MNAVYLGEIAALLASFCFAIGPTFNTLATRGVSVPTLNRARLGFTFLLLLLPHLFLEGSLFPTAINSSNLLWLGFSGLFTLVLGESLSLAAFSRIGTRLSMLIISLIPVISAILALFILGEKLTWVQAIGILVTILGIIWVVSDRKNGGAVDPNNPRYLQGILLAVGASFMHAFGNIAAKLGLMGEVSPLSGHLLRVGIALSILLALMWMQGETKTTLTELKTAPLTIKHFFIGAVFGPMLGSWLMMIALDYTSVGIASLLNSLSPIWLLPVGRFYFQERVGLRAVAGSLVAVLGVAILLMV